MSRSLKKGPLINERLLKKVMMQKEGSNRDTIKTWARDCQIPPEFVGHIFGVHNGKHFITVKVVEGMENLEEPSELEQAGLATFATDPSERLMCVCRIKKGTVKVEY
jgi:small subunit ribosomal protein S19